jgi:hypothetical protein
MAFPWTEQATLVRLTAASETDDQNSEVLFEGPLLALARRVRQMKPQDLQRLRLSLPDRTIRPYTFQGDVYIYSDSGNTPASLGAVTKRKLRWEFFSTPSRA